MVKKQQQVVFYDDDDNIHRTLGSAIKSSVSSFAERTFDSGGTEDWSARAANNMAHRYEAFMAFFVNLNKELGEIAEDPNKTAAKEFATVEVIPLIVLLEFYKSLVKYQSDLPEPIRNQLDQILPYVVKLWDAAQ